MISNFGVDFLFYLSIILSVLVYHVTKSDVICWDDASTPCSCRKNPEDPKNLECRGVGLSNGHVLLGVPAYPTVSLTLSSGFRSRIDDNDIIPQTKAHLVTLDLSQNYIQDVGIGAFRGMRALKRLNLAGNKMKSLPDGIFDGAENLEYLDLSNNRIERLKPKTFSQLTSLKILDLSGNSLRRLPAGAFVGLSSLEELKISGNALQIIQLASFQGLPTLSRLFLDKNRLNRIPEIGIRTLTELDISGNPLWSLTDEAFLDLEKLSILRMEKTELEAIPKNAFCGFRKVSEIYLGKNVHLESIENSCLDRLQGLKSLDIGGCNFSTLPKLSAVPDLRVRGNPMVCDCRLTWIFDARRDDVAKQLTCAGPPSLKGKALSSISPSSLSCDGQQQAVVNRSLRFPDMKGIMAACAEQMKLITYLLACIVCTIPTILLILAFYWKRKLLFNLVVRPQLRKCESCHELHDRVRSVTAGIVPTLSINFAALLHKEPSKLFKRIPTQIEHMFTTTKEQKYSPL